MKKSKLLLATPLMLAPVIATLPVVTSCSKKSDVTLTGDFAKNVDIETYEEPLVIGEPYVISLSIKQDLRGKQYLPNTLTTVKSGDVELWLYEEDEMSNGIFDYYEYIPFDNNTRAYLYINNVSGKISIQATTSQLDHITATPIEVTGSGKVEYEVGETANKANRILATGTLKNDDIILLTDYSIKLDTFDSDYTFKTEDISKTSSGKSGTISYNGLTSNQFTFKVIAKTVALMSYSTVLTDPVITKYSSFAGENDTTYTGSAIDTYNNETHGGYYTIFVRPGTYTFSDSITIKETDGKYLSIESLLPPDIEEWVMNCSVKFKLNTNNSITSLLKIVNSSATTTPNCLVSLYGIEFLQPTVGTVGSFDHISLNTDSTATAAPCNITISACKFMGNEDESTTFPVTAVGSGYQANAGYPLNIDISLCVGNYLHFLFDGNIHHDPSSLYDLSITACYLNNSQQFAQVISESEADILIGGVVANIMYTKDESTTTTLTSALSIVGAGTYTIRNSIFNKLAQLDNSVNNAGFIEGKTSSTTTDIHHINLYNVEFNDEFEDDNMHTVLNSTNKQDVDWHIRVLYDLLPVVDGTAYGIADESAEKYIYWDIDAE